MARFPTLPPYTVEEFKEWRRSKELGGYFPEIPAGAHATRLEKEDIDWIFQVAIRLFAHWIVDEHPPIDDAPEDAPYSDTEMMVSFASTVMADLRDLVDRNLSTDQDLTDVISDNTMAPRFFESCEFHVSPQEVDALWSAILRLRAAFQVGPNTKPIDDLAQKMFLLAAWREMAPGHFTVRERFEARIRGNLSFADSDNIIEPARHRMRITPPRLNRRITLGRHIMRYRWWSIIHPDYPRGKPVRLLSAFGIRDLMDATDCVIHVAGFLFAACLVTASDYESSEGSEEEGPL